MTCCTRKSTVCFPTPNSNVSVSHTFLLHQHLWPGPHCTTQLTLHAHSGTAPSSDRSVMPSFRCHKKRRGFPTPRRNRTQTPYQNSDLHITQQTRITSNKKPHEDAYTPKLCKSPTFGQGLKTAASWKCVKARKVTRPTFVRPPTPEKQDTRKLTRGEGEGWYTL